MTLSELLTAINKHNQIAEMLGERKHSVTVYIDGIELKNYVDLDANDTFSNRHDFFLSVREEYIEPCARDIEYLAHAKDLVPLHPENPSGRGYLVDFENEKFTDHRIGVVING